MVWLDGRYQPILYESVCSHACAAKEALVALLYLESDALDYNRGLVKKAALSLDPVMKKTVRQRSFGSNHASIMTDEVDIRNADGMSIWSEHPTSPRLWWLGARLYVRLLPHVEHSYAAVLFMLKVTRERSHEVEIVDDRRAHEPVPSYNKHHASCMVLECCANLFDGIRAVTNNHDPRVSP
jgi:hypothetical protein